MLLEKVHVKTNTVCTLRDSRHCEKLLDKGADVNLCSALDETAIGVAVANLHVDNGPTSWDVEMFDLPAKPGHKEETLNKRTVKKKLLPITSAVGTGRPEVVEQLLKMGADSNRRGPDDQNPSVYLHLLPYDGSKLKRWFGRYVFNAYHAQVFGPFVWIYRWVFRV